MLYVVLAAAKKVHLKLFGVDFVYDGPGPEFIDEKKRSPGAPYRSH